MTENNTPQPPAAPPPTFLDELAAFVKTPGGAFLTALAGTLLVGGAVSALSGGRSRRPVVRQPPPPRGLLPYTLFELQQRRALGADEQIAINRENGADFEERAGRKLKRDHPDAEIIPQVTVTTPDGRKRRLDYAIAHPNGAVTAVEVKNVNKVTEANVRQAEDGRAGLQGRVRDVSAERDGGPLPGSTGARSAPTRGPCAALADPLVGEPRRSDDRRRRLRSPAGGEPARDRGGARARSAERLPDPAE